MNIRPKQTRNGSALLVTVITCTLVGTVLCSYLVLVLNRNKVAMRATAWNSAIPVLEAGIEEALTHLNVDADKPAANNWTETISDGRTYYWKRRDLSDGSYYAVTNYDVASTSPSIVSAGYVRSPLKSDEYISRLVKVTATNPPSGFNRAIAANGPIRLSGDVVVDGFNSAGFKSAVEAYRSANNRRANGGIATNSREAQAIEVGTAHVYGTAATGKGGKVTVAGGSIGDFDWSKVNTGIQPGWVGEADMNVSFDPISPPQGNPTWLPPTTHAVGGSNITVLGNGTYSVDSFNSNDQKKPLVVTGQAVLWVKEDFTVSGQANTGGYVYIAPGASLTLYVGGRNTSISGGGIVNATGLPGSFAYYGLPRNKLFAYSGAASFIGTINAPHADVRLSGDSSIYGAIICNTIACSGRSSIHYDQSLVGPGKLIVSDWREL